MKKLAIFVEGLTEQLFVAKLLKEIAGEKNIYIEEQKSIKTKSGNRSFVVINASSRPPVNQKYYVLIRDCGGDSTVKSDIREACESLAKKKYEKVIGLRDVYPASISDIPKIERELRFGMPTKYLPIHIMLAVMEVEAWFLAEKSHLKRIHSSLTAGLIRRKLGLDLSPIDIEKIVHPADVLDKIYKLVGFSYAKNEKSIKRTVTALDCGVIYLDLKDRVNRLGRFVQQIDSFLV